MRFKFRNKKTTVIAVFLVMAVAGAAFAYWTAGGSGTGTGTTGTAVPITAVQTSTVSLMGPGIAPQALSGNFTNLNTSPVHVESVTAAVTAVTTVPPGGDCEIDDYEITGTPSAAQEVAVGTAQGAWSGQSIAFVNNLAENQDGCKLATVTITYTIV